MRRALVLAVVVAITTTTTAAAAVPRPRPPKCLTWTDPAGDAGMLSPQVTGDPHLDITSVRLGVVRDTLEARITVADLGAAPEKAWGDRFHVHFFHKSDLVEIYYKRSPTRDQEGELFYQQGIRVNGVFKTDLGVTGGYDETANVMTLTTRMKELRAWAGKSIDRAVVDRIDVVVHGSYVAQNFRWDSAPATGRQFLVAPCA